MRHRSILRGLAILSLAAFLPAIALADKAPPSPPINPRETPSSAQGNNDKLSPAPEGAQTLGGKPGSPGKSGEAPGKAGDPGKSGDAPGHNKDKDKGGDPGKSAEAPGKDGEPGAGQAEGQGKPDEATKEARKAARKASREKNAKAEKEAVRAKVSGALKGQPMARAMKEELERHARRLARLRRVRDVAEDESDTATLERVDKLIAKENARHDRWLGNYDAKAGDAKAGAP